MLSGEPLNYAGMFVFLVSTVLATHTNLRIQIYEANWDERHWHYPPVVGSNGYIGAATSYSYSFYGPPFDPSYESSNDTFSFPVYELIRGGYSDYSYNEYWWFGKLANGTQIANGNYT